MPTGTTKLVPANIEHKLINGEPPFDGVDAVFVSHYHGDHFTPEAMLELLAARPEIRLYGPQQATSALLALPGAEAANLADRTESIHLEYQQEPVQFQMNGILVEAVRIPHSGWPESRTEVENIVYRVTLDAKTTVVHMGDADPNDVHFSRDASWWAKRKTDMAFPPYWFFTSKQGNEILKERIEAQHSVGVHVPKNMPDDWTSRPSDIQGYDLFTRPGESRLIRDDG